MSEQDMTRRIEKLEGEIDKLCVITHDLNLTVAVLNKTVESMRSTEKGRAELRDKSILFTVGGFISAVIVWVINGGLIK